jgi:hypothetical protein
MDDLKFRNQLLVLWPYKPPRTFIDQRLSLQQSIDDTASATVNVFFLPRFRWQDSSLGIQVHALLSQDTPQKSNNEMIFQDK